MAFPERIVATIPSYCICHNEPKFIYYKCPNCQTPKCEISSSCKICRVMLVSAVHLSRTTQGSSSQTEAIKPFLMMKQYLALDDLTRMQVDEGAGSSINEDASLLLQKHNNWKNIQGFLVPREDHEGVLIHCNGCEKQLNTQSDSPDNVVCPRCNKLYCLDCDIFIHETLLSCPTCQLLS